MTAKNIPKIKFFSVSVIVPLKRLVKLATLRTNNCILQEKEKSSVDSELKMDNFLRNKKGIETCYLGPLLAQALSVL